MESGIVLVVLLVLGVPTALAIWLVARALGASNSIEELSRRLQSLESEISRLKREKEAAKPEATRPVAAAAAPSPETITPVPGVPPKPTVIPELIVSQSATAKAGTTSSAARPATPLASALPPVPTTPDLPPIAPALPPPIPKLPVSEPTVDWEQFMGVKGFAWIGGLALFLGVAFFVKYSFDNNLVPPELRVAIGFLTGLGLLVGGMVMSRRNFPALSQTLCATGVVILYAVTFACRSVYHFAFFGPLPTFLVMALITTTAFFLAVRLNALVVAILGMLGGFLTPILLSTGEDNPLGLFGYVAILDTGLIVVALNRRWYFLPALAAFGTVAMQAGWMEKFFVSEHYIEGNKILIALGVLLGFNVLYLAANWWTKRRGQSSPWLSSSALGLVAVALMFTAWFLSFAPLAQRPWLMFGFVFLIDLIAIAIGWLDRSVSPCQPVSGIAVFGLLAFWTQETLSNELLNAALVFYFAFAILHSALPVLLQRQQGRQSGSASQTWANHLFPIFALALVLVPVFKFTEVSFIVWPFILLVDLLAIVLAVLTARLLPVLAVLLLTFAATGALIFKIPADLTGLPVPFFLLGAFVVFFVAISVWLIKKFKPEALKTGIKFGDNPAAPEDLAAILPACSVVLPFLLLIMATLRLPLINPTPVFGLALLLVILLLGVTRLFLTLWMPAIGLACVTALECTWHFNHFDATNANQPLDLVLAWYLIFFAVFALFPFLFLRQFSSRVVPWATAALAAVPQFFLIHRFVSAVYPNPVIGLLPAAFAVPGLLSVAVVLNRIPAETKARLSQLAWFGGVSLFFITLIFPIQFDRQWLTIGWALEGAALLWLFHRVPHPGLRLAGIGLLVAAFARLAFNPCVLDYHPRTTTPIFNWYLYAYGVVIICLFGGARLLAPPRNLVFKSNVPPILGGLGTALAFLLLNIEIADYFSEPGQTLTFQFSGNFARDMTYSIAWALFALGLLVYGIIKKAPAARYTATGLLCATLLKLFFHDLAQLSQLYRIGAFISVAIIAMLASFAYQKFFAAGNPVKASADEKPL
jgi:uncharacterized membrane protein